MDFEWVAIALGDVTWISLAFSLGFLARLVNLPPLVGFLATEPVQTPTDHLQIIYNSIRGLFPDDTIVNSRQKGK